MSSRSLSSNSRDSSCRFDITVWSTSAVLERFLTGLPQRLPVGGGQVVMNSVLVDVDGETGQTVGVERIDKEDN